MYTESVLLTRHCLCHQVFEVESEKKIVHTAQTICTNTLPKKKKLMANKENDDAHEDDERNEMRNKNFDYSNNIVRNATHPNNIKNKKIVLVRKQHIKFLIGLSFFMHSLFVSYYLHKNLSSTVCMPYSTWNV